MARALLAGLALWLALWLLLPQASRSQLRSGLLRAAETTRYRKNKKVILAIALHESANFSSDVFLKCGNPFGLKTFTPTNCQAPTSENPPGRVMYYRSFKNIAEAVKAFEQWCSRKGIPENLNDEDFLTAVYKAGYATDPGYIEKVKRYF